MITSSEKLDTLLEGNKKSKSSSSRIFGGGGGNKKVNESTDALPAVVRKTRSFKRIRGLFSGKKSGSSSRKDRNKDKTSGKSTTAGIESSGGASGKGGSGDDASTVYQVDVDDRSLMTTRSSQATEVVEALSTHGMKAVEETGATLVSPLFLKNNVKLKVVLLLVDPETRRFELLQLEFDSLKAVVSDVLAQIPISVTEETLRSKAYAGITNKEGLEFNSDQLLSVFCFGNDILVAVPEGVPAKESARLARPILSDDKVVSMLLSSGIDASSWREKKKKRSNNSSRAAAATSGDGSGVTGGTGGTGGNTKTLIILAVVLLSILLQVFHMYISTAIKPGHLVSPGIWLTKCGILGLIPIAEPWALCDNNARLDFSSNGVVTLYNSANDPLWEMHGGVCAEGDASCVPGMHVKEDNTIVIGGKVVSTVLMYEASAELSPWPFAETPNVSTRFARRSLLSL